MVRTIARWLLAAFLLFTGVVHFAATETFTRQVPPWIPAPTAVVWITGVMEIGFGVALVATARGARRRGVGWFLAAFFVMVFVGNIHQAASGAEAFGLDTDLERWGRLAFQPVLIVWALWACEVLGQDPAGGEAPAADDVPPG